MRSSAQPVQACEKPLEMAALASFVDGALRARRSAPHPAAARATTCRQEKQKRAVLANGPTAACRPARSAKALCTRTTGAGWSSPSPQAYSALDAVGAAATQLRRTTSAGRPATPTLDGWNDVPARRSPSSSVTAMSSDASASPPPSLQADCSVLRDASLCDGGEVPETQSLDVLREQLRLMQLRLAESESTASALGHELGARDDHFSCSLATLQSEHAFAMQTLESSLRAEVRARESRGRHVAPPARESLRCHAGVTDQPPRFFGAGSPKPRAVWLACHFSRATRPLAHRAPRARRTSSAAGHPRRGPFEGTGLTHAAQAQDALDAAASELEAAASERAHLWSLLRDCGKDNAPQQRAAHPRRPAEHVTSARAAAWATP